MRQYIIYDSESSKDYPNKIRTTYIDAYEESVKLAIQKAMEVGRTVVVYKAVAKAVPTRSVDLQTLT